MFKIMKSLTKAAVGATIVTPVSIAADIVTLGGVITNRNKPYTSEAISDIMDNLKDASNPEENTNE
jgi:hypothetical protein